MIHLNGQSNSFQGQKYFVHGQKFFVLDKIFWSPVKSSFLFMRIQFRSCSKFFVQDKNFLSGTKFFFVLDKMFFSGTKNYFVHADGWGISYYFNSTSNNLYLRSWPRVPLVLLSSSSYCSVWFWCRRILNPPRISFFILWNPNSPH